MSDTLTNAPTKGGDLRAWLTGGTDAPAPEPEPTVDLTFPVGAGKSVTIPGVGPAIVEIPAEPEPAAEVQPEPEPAAVPEPVVEPEVIDKVQTTYANLNLTFAGTLLNVRLAACGVRRPGLGDDVKTSGFCPHPDHKDQPAKADQVYQCSVDHKHGPYSRGELSRGRPNADGKMVVLDQAAIDQVRFGDHESGTVEFQAFPARDVLEATRPGEKQYRLRPATKATARETTLCMSLITAIDDLALADEPLVLVGRCRIKASIATYRLETWRGQLCMTELIQPADLAAADDLTDIDENEKMTALVAATLADSVEPWTPEMFTNDRAARMKALVEATDAGTVAPVAKPKAKGDEVDDLLAQLEASVALADQRRTA